MPDTCCGGDIAEGVGAIVQDSMDIATHAVDKAKEVFTGKDDAVDE